MGCFPAVPSLALSRTLPSSAPAVTSPPIGSVDPQSLPPLPQLRGSKSGALFDGG
uniref:Uncharacterized protein n=1 Tax=Oryza rufipogon TaxID=4529 RepID=A0A0E0NRA6_ORYRU